MSDLPSLKKTGQLNSFEVQNIARRIPNALLRHKFEDQMNLQLQNHDRLSPRGPVSVRQAQQVLENREEHIGRHGIRDGQLQDLKDAINNKL
jgi:hypothetical protein